MEKHIHVILDFYYELITAKQFVDYLNTHDDLQKKFNRVLKKSIPENNGTPTEYLNLISSKIGTTADSPITSKDGKEHIWSNSSQSFLILLYAKEFLAKSDAFFYLSQEEITDLIVADVTDNGAFYNATQHVETYIKDRIIKDMPPIKSLSAAIKYVKNQMKTHFVCDKKMPQWLQSCEWAFNANGKPMVFRSQKGTAFEQHYTFYDNTTGEETNIVQNN
ncbi:MAG: hypothetical protein K2O39_07070 [Clostridiales bacterium]|nr:hypothetical protein [Clostridiales bacterium]